jgi:hypothetical protein
MIKTVAKFQTIILICIAVWAFDLHGPTCFYIATIGNQDQSKISTTSIGIKNYGLSVHLILGELSLLIGKHEHPTHTRIEYRPKISQ